MKCYLAGPLFTEAERTWHRSTKEAILSLAVRAGKPLEVIWPYEMLTREDTAALGQRAMFEIHRLCRSHLDDTDILIALLDGPQVDDGTAWEIGYFYARKPPHACIIGVRTDFRQAGENPGAKVNAMIEVSCNAIADSTAGLLGLIEAALQS